LYRAREFVKSCIQSWGKNALLRAETALETGLTVHPKLNGEDGSQPMGATGTDARLVRALIALTNDPLLIKALQELAAGNIDVSVVTDLRGLTDELLQQTGATALIDAAALEIPLDGVIDTLHNQLPDLRLMIAGGGAEQQQLATRVADQTVFRFVHKPASPARLKLFLDAAARPERRLGSATTPPPAAGREPLARIETAVLGKSPRTVAIIGVAVIAAIAAAAWAFWPEDPAAAADPGRGSAVDGSKLAQPQVAALISQARAALEAARFVASDGSSAAELYRSALKLDPANQVASDGYERAIEQALRSAEESLIAGKLNDAGVIAEAVRLIDPENSRLAFLNTQISRELARVNADASQRQALETRQTQIRAALTVMERRLQQRALIDPLTGSAVSSFREAQAIGANDPAVRGARETLVAALLTAADAELSARRPPAAKRFVDAAGSINNNASGLDVLRRRVEEAMTQLLAPRIEPAPEVAERAETPAPALQEPPVVNPAVTASPQATAADEVVSASALRLLRKQDPVYPPLALDNLISGWVEMEFTVTTNGSVKDIVVRNAEPGNTFNSAATAALSRYRYAPVMQNGQPVAQRAHLRMRFTAKDAP
jgi:protein TonB